jgi:class I fructose-bisphosphate aldolase
MLTKKVTDIISRCYSNENAGIKTNIIRILMHGKLGGTGKLIILPVDQGFEHGPDKSFSTNATSYDPDYHYQIAIEAGLSAYSAPLGMLETAISNYVGAIPLILKLNSASSLFPKNDYPDQAFTSSVQDALRLGCSAVGLTLYPGSHNFKNMLEEAREVIKEAKTYGLPTVTWCYPRGGDISKNLETALDIIAYSAHIACEIGAHIIKVKLPSEKLLNTDLKYNNIDNLSDRIAIVKRACFNNRKLVVFSGGEAKNDESLYSEIKAINAGGGDGSIIGRNVFQREKSQAIELLNNIIAIYSN